MSLPAYRVILSYDADRQSYAAHAPELPHCVGEGPSRAEAIARLEEEIAAQVENMRASGTEPPRPLDEAPPSGELRLVLSRSLARELAWQARQEGVPTEQLATEMIAAATEARASWQTVRPRRNGDREPLRRDGNDSRGPRYDPLDDRAHFIEYVRSLEHREQQGGNGNHRRRNDTGRMRGNGGGNRRG